MADRGFTIHESVAFKRAKLVIPSFTKGKDQLDPVDVEINKGYCACPHPCGKSHRSFTWQIHDTTGDTSY